MVCWKNSVLTTGIFCLAFASSLNAKTALERKLGIEELCRQALERSVPSDEAFIREDVPFDWSKDPKLHPPFQDRELNVENLGLESLLSYHRDGVRHVFSIHQGYYSAFRDAGRHEDTNLANWNVFFAELEREARTNQSVADFISRWQLTADRIPRFIRFGKARLNGQSYLRLELEDEYGIYHHLNVDSHVYYARYTADGKKVNVTSETTRDHFVEAIREAAKSNSNLAKAVDAGAIDGIQLEK